MVRAATLKANADALVKVFFALKKTHPALVTDELWTAIKAWRESELLAALSEFSISSDVSAFDRLLAKAPA